MSNAKENKNNTKEQRLVVRDWVCNECGKKMTFRQAERAMFGPNGCGKCGGGDIEVSGIKKIMAKYKR